MNEYLQKFKFDVDQKIEEIPQHSANPAKVANLLNRISRISKISKQKTETEIKNSTSQHNFKRPNLKDILALSNEVESFEERAAIIEFDGEKTRDEANHLAYEHLMEKLESKLCFSWLIFNKHYKTIH